MNNTEFKKQLPGVSLHPILFSTPMVQAIIEGRKTQTRRAIKSSPVKLPGSDMYINTSVWMKQMDTLIKKGFSIIKNNLIFPDCVYGKPGDILWVRETFVDGLNHCWDDEDENPRFGYKVDCPSDQINNIKWTPSIHMPFEACRLFLRIKSVRVERLNDLSEDDAKSEGVQKHDLIPSKFIHYSPELSFHKSDLKEGFAYTHSAKASFMTLWKKINGSESWEENPWVWVIEFERVSKDSILKKNS